MKTLMIALMLCCLTVEAQAADIIIRTKAGKTLLQAANEIKGYLNRSNVSAAKVEDMLGDCMTPITTATTTYKGAIGQKYARIRIPDSYLDNVVNIAPSATTLDLVQVGGDFDVDPGVWVGKIA
jgi:hypothetical protein